MKRGLSPSDVSEGASQKKRKEKSDQGPPDGFVPSPNLQISVLTWKGEPTTYDVDGNELLGYVGAYINVASSSLTYID